MLFKVGLRLHCRYLCISHQYSGITAIHCVNACLVSDVLLKQRLGFIQPLPRVIALKKKPGVTTASAKHAGHMNLIKVAHSNPRQISIRSDVLFAPLDHNNRVVIPIFQILVCYSHCIYSVRWDVFSF